MQTKSEIVNLVTGEAVIHEDYTVQKTGEYPHDWFAKNPKRKPSLEIPINGPLEDFVRRMQHLDLSEFTPNFACLILSKYYNTVRAKLEENWESKGVLIGRAGDEITPLSLFEITEALDADGLISNETINLDAFIGALLLIYRLNQMPSGVSTTDIIGRLTQRYQALYNSKPPLSFSNVLISLGLWDSDLNHRKLVAGLGMFLEKFPNHPKGKLKFGTLSSKWRDCSALKTLYEMYPTLGFSHLEDLIPWFWEGAIREDAWRILLKPLSLRSDGVSYFFYMADMGFVNKSVYSAEVNPALHVFCQVIHCASGNPRGVNARMLFPNQVNAVVRNALMVSFALDKSSPKGIKIVPVKQREQFRQFAEQQARKRQLMETMEDEEDEQE